MELTFYDSGGTPTAYCEDEKHIYLFSGQPVAYFSKDSVYAYSGVHLGRFSKGWIRDNNGYCVFYTSKARGGPMKPMKEMKPMKGMKGMKPMKSIKQMKPMKPMNKSAWSDLSGEGFFFQR